MPFSTGGASETRPVNMVLKDQYPTSTDRNIDHRRVPNLQKFFERRKASLSVSDDPGDYAPGDLVTQMIGGRLPHIVVSRPVCVVIGGEHIFRSEHFTTAAGVVCNDFRTIEQIVRERGIEQ